MRQPPRRIAPLVTAVVIITGIVGGLSTAGLARDAAAQRARAGAPRPAGTVAGVTFTVDTAPDRGSSADAPAAARLFTGATAVVTATADRGRVDVLAARPTRASVAGLPVTGPAARPGDYYLFDRAGVVLVRPRARTYARIAFTDYGIGGADDRTGWPSTIFRVTPVRVAALPGGARRADARAWARDLVVYWHLDVDQEASTYHVLARGRLGAARLPLGEAGVVRWFGPAQALARLPDLNALRAAAEVGITAVTSVPAAAGRGGLTALVQHALTRLRAVDVDPTRLALPIGYTEQVWPADVGTGR